MSAQSITEILTLALAVKSRFRCKGIARKPDAHSWAVEQDFLAGVEWAFALRGEPFPEIIRECQSEKRSITTLTAARIAACLGGEA